MNDEGEGDRNSDEHKGPWATELVDTARVAARNKRTLRTRRHLGVLSSKWPNTMLPIAKIAATRATSNQESMCDAEVSVAV